MSKYLQFDIESASVIEEPSDSRFATAKIQAFSSGKNLHDMVCSEEVLQETAPTIYNTPILYSIDKNLQDFYTHIEPERSLICGFIVPNSAEFVRKEDGRLSLTVLAKIWKKYSPKVIEFFKRDSQNKKRVSVEMELYSAEDRDDGLANMLSFKYFGVCLIGDFVREASPGANAQIISFSEEQKEYDQAYLAEFADKYSELDFAIPKKVKENAQNGLDLYAKHKRGGTSVSLSVARFLTKNEVATPKKVEHISKHMLLHSEDDFSDKTGKSWIGWQLRGGNESLGWSRKLVESMTRIKERKLSYFSKEGELITMPYTRLKDIAPALKGLDPPITLEQANKISAQADAIGGEYGWPTAIKKFKETHEPNKDGTAWVEKSKEEKMADEEKLAEEEKKKLEMAAQAELDEKKKAEDAKFAEDEAKKKAEEEEAKKFSLDTYLDVAATLAFLKAETESNDEIAEEQKTKLSMAVDELGKAEMADSGVVMSGMFAVMCRMSAKMSKMADAKKVVDEEMSALKEFKANIEAQQKQFAVEQTLRELDEKVVIPDDARVAMLADVENYSIAEINVWQNNCKARSFDFALKVSKDGKKPEIKRYPMPFVGIPVRPSNDVWAGAKK